jgi:hypothetical protein
MKLWQRIRRAFEPKVGYIVPGGKLARLYQFDRPNDDAMARIREILASIDITHHVDREAPKDRKRRHAIGEKTLVDVVRYVRAKLVEDHAENARDYAEGNVGFDYVVSLDVHYSGNVAVLTRLFNRMDAHVGSVFYGLELRRIANDRYLIWDEK